MTPFEFVAKNPNDWQFISKLIEIYSKDEQASLRKIAKEMGITYVAVFKRISSISERLRLTLGLTPKLTPRLTPNNIEFVCKSIFYGFQNEAKVNTWVNTQVNTKVNTTKKKETKKDKEKEEHSSSQTLLFEEEIEKKEINKEENPETPNGVCSQQAENPCEVVKELWDSICGTTLHKIIKLSEARKQTIRARVKDCGENYKEDFGKVFTFLITNSFYTGDNERHWVANLDWVLKASNFIRLLEKADRSKASTVQVNNQEQQPLEQLRSRYPYIFSRDQNLNMGTINYYKGRFGEGMLMQILDKIEKEKPQFAILANLLNTL